MTDSPTMTVEESIVNMCGPADTTRQINSSSIFHPSILSQSQQNIILQNTSIDTADKSNFQTLQLQNENLAIELQEAKLQLAQ